MSKLSNVVCEMYLKDDFITIMSDCYCENLYKCNRDTMRISQYDDKNPLDDFIDDLMQSEYITMDKGFYNQLCDYCNACIDDNEIFGKALEMLKSGEISIE